MSLYCYGSAIPPPTNQSQKQVTSYSPSSGVSPEVVTSYIPEPVSISPEISDSSYQLKTHSLNLQSKEDGGVEILSHVG